MEVTFRSGPGTRYYNVYPCFPYGGLYDGFRRDRSRCADPLARRLSGCAANGTIFWSSDIYPTWDTLTATDYDRARFHRLRIAYWGNDTGGWQYLAGGASSAHPPLIDPSDARDNVGGYDDYPEFTPAGLSTRRSDLTSVRTAAVDYNEVWSYGKQAEPILEKYLKLRYQLMPYIFTRLDITPTRQAPRYMRALFMDFPQDPKVADIGDEYMFGPALLVAPSYRTGRNQPQSVLTRRNGLV